MEQRTINSYRHSTAKCYRVSIPMAVKGHDERLGLLHGTLDMLILRTGQWGRQHGLGLGQIIRRRSEELIRIEAGSLYPALHRLERQSWLASGWKTSEKNNAAGTTALELPENGRLSQSSPDRNGG
jgi:PadR family transcriptional regulator